MTVIKYINGIEFESQLINKMADAIYEYEYKKHGYGEILYKEETLAYWREICYVAYDVMKDDFIDTLRDIWDREKPNEY